MNREISATMLRPRDQNFRTNVGEYSDAGFTTKRDPEASRVAESDPESEVFGWSGVPNYTGSRSRIFCPTPTPDVQLDNFLHHTPKLGIPVIIYFVETEISCCLPLFPLILTYQFHSLYVKESESEILERSESRVGVGYFTSDSATLEARLTKLRNYLSDQDYTHLDVKPPELSDVSGNSEVL